MGPKAFPSISNAVCLPNIYGMFSSSKTKLPHLPKGEISWSINTAWILTFLWSRTSLLAAMIPINKGRHCFLCSTDPHTTGCESETRHRKESCRKRSPSSEVNLTVRKWKAQTTPFPSPFPPIHSVHALRKGGVRQQAVTSPKHEGKWILTLCAVLLPGLKLRSAEEEKKKTITESKARQSINFCSKPGIALVRFASLFQTGIGWFQVSPSYRTREGSQHILISLPFMLKATQAEDEPFCSVRFQTSSGHHQHLSPKLSCIMGHSAVKPLHQPWCPQRYLSSPTLFPQKGVLSGVLSPLDCKELYTAATLSHYSSI